MQVAYALGLILAFDVSLGFNGFSYGVLYDYFLPFRSLRSPARWASWSASRSRCWPDSALRGSPIASAVASAASRLCRDGRGDSDQYVSTPIPLQPIPRDVPRCMPTSCAIGRSRACRSWSIRCRRATIRPTCIYSTFHWQPLLNGYSGFFPASYFEMLAAAESFPDAAFFDAIKARGVRYLLVHQERMIGSRYVRMIPELDRGPISR